jgi:TolB protein
MKIHKVLTIGLSIVCCNTAMAQPATAPATGSEKDAKLEYKDEKHFKNMRQLTFGGDNAEAYFGFDNEHVTFQRTNTKEGVECDQIFYGSIPKSGKGKFNYKLVSTGKGRTTCAYLMPDKKHFLYASTHLVADTCPPVPDRNKIKKYVWPIYEGYDIFVADFKGKITKQLTNSPGYDAEGTISPDGKKIIFTSMRNGDMDLYTMNIDGTDVKQITSTLGYDGGACFSPDGKMITWRASRPKTEEEAKEYKDLLTQGLVMPTRMELFVANADGSNARQVTNLGRANWAPAFMPDSKRLIFASNHEHERGYPFNLYMVNLDGTGLERLSNDNSFDAFPMFSPDGKKLIFSSNRNNHGNRDTNVFICDWVD